MRKLLAMVLACVLSSTLYAGSLYTLSLSNTTGTPGNQSLVTVTIDNAGDPIQGWSYGVCDGADLAVDMAVDGSGTSTVRAGGPPSFSDINMEPGGVTHGVVIDFDAIETLGAVSGFEALDITYNVSGLPGTTASVDFCETLGGPPVEVVVVVDGEAIDPTTNNGSIAIENENTFTWETVQAGPGNSVTANVLLTSIEDISGFQVSATYDDSLVDLDGVAETGAAAGADFVGVQVAAGGEIVLGVVIDTSDPIDTVIAPGNDQPIIAADFTVDAGAALGSFAALTFVDGLGSPAIDNLYTDPAGDTFPPSLVNGGIDISAVLFIRGDCNRDDQVDLADGIFFIQEFFVAATTLACEDACDQNDDGDLDVSDPIYGWNYLLLDGPPPPAPFPAAGTDPTDTDLLGCDS